MLLHEILKEISNESQKGKVFLSIPSRLHSLTKNALLRRGFLIKKHQKEFIVSWGHVSYKQYASHLTLAEREYMIASTSVIKTLKKRVIK